MHTPTRLFLRLSGVLLALLLAAALTGGAAAEPGASVYDDFDELYLMPDPQAKWWVVNTGDGMTTEGFEGDASKIELLNEGGTSFARLSLLPDETPGSYTTPEISELPTGQAAGQPGRWLPTPGHPVVLEARVRWSEQFDPLGLNAIGSSGVWLWNSPVDENGGYLPVDAIGFSWSQVGNLLVGTHVEVLMDTVPLFTVPLLLVDLQEWNTFKVVWQTALLGVTQKASFYVNGQLVGVSLPFPNLPPLSVEIWNDNQIFLLVESIYLNPPTAQHFDLDYISVHQP
jgi:hypothetical protein